MIDRNINQLIAYGRQKDFLANDDIVYAVNRILFLLKLESHDYEEINEEIDFFGVMKEILDYAVEQKLIEDTIVNRDAFEAKIVDCMLPRPSELNDAFYKKYKTGPLTATNFFHDFSVATNYIKTERIKKNIEYVYEGKYAPLDITINLSKPEKDPKDIQKQLSAAEKYPKCPLCMENVGVYESTSLAPRSNHRVINLTLNHEKDAWGLQFSPYAYFNEHLIVLRKEHSPMYVNERTFAELVDFVNKFPHYLIGSNAGLPIVGGSILSHHHFQGGKYDFPIEKARVLQTYKRGRVKVEVLDWPMAAIRVVGNNENHLLDMVGQIYREWNNYENKEINIFRETEEFHNALTPILKLNGADYNFYLIFRNNYTTKERHYGLFHPREELFHIKKENIGLIEVMGLAILPGRLLHELEEIKECLLNKKDYKEYPDLEKHGHWIEDLMKRDLPMDDLYEYLKKDVGNIFEQVLEDCNVFRYGTKEDLLRFVEKAIY